MIGTKIIARKTSVDYGYVKGDTLEIVGYREISGVFCAKNLTRPGYGGNDIAYLFGKEFKVVSGNDKRIKRIIEVFGVPIYKEYIKGGTND